MPLRQLTGADKWVHSAIRLRHGTVAHWLHPHAPCAVSTLAATLGGVVPIPVLLVSVTISSKTPIPFSLTVGTPMVASTSNRGQNTLALPQHPSYGHAEALHIGVAVLHAACHCKHHVLALYPPL